MIEACGRGVSIGIGMVFTVRRAEMIDCMYKKGIIAKECSVSKKRGGG